MTGQSPNASRRDRAAPPAFLALIFVCLGGWHRHGRLPLLPESRAQLPLRGRAPAFSDADLKVGDDPVGHERLVMVPFSSRTAVSRGFVRRFLEKPEDAKLTTDFTCGSKDSRRPNQYENVRLLDARGVTRLSVPEGAPKCLSTGRPAHFPKSFRPTR